MPLSELDLSKWREQVGWMSQHPYLLADTLRANLRLAAPDADDARLLQALHFAELDKWFSTLDDGLDTRLGENGRQLSGGQLRRLALARVYLSDAEILLFDEPTASLDEDLEQTLLAGIEKLCHDKTVLLLTHRSAPLALADNIAILENGKIMQGSLQKMRETVPQVTAFLDDRKARQFHSLAAIDEGL